MGNGVKKRGVSGLLGRDWGKTECLKAPYLLVINTKELSVALPVMRILEGLCILRAL